MVTTVGNQRSFDGDTRLDQRHRGHIEVLEGHGQGVDGRLGCHHGQEGLPVGLGGGADEEAVDPCRLVVGIVGLHSDKLVGTQTFGIGLLALGSGKNDDAAAHLGSKLNSQVTETTDANDTNRLVPLDIGKRREDGGTSALQRSSKLVRDAVGNRVQVALGPNGSVSKAALVGGGVSVQAAVRAEVVIALETVCASTAGAVYVAPADAVTLLQVLDVGTDVLDDADAFMSEHNISSFLWGVLARYPGQNGSFVTYVVQVSATETRRCDLDVDLVAGELVWPGGLVLLGVAILGALEDCERRHCGLFGIETQKQEAYG